MSGKSMTKREYMNFLEKVAEDEYIKDSKKSIFRNFHQNNLIGHEKIKQKIIDAVIVDFINAVGRAHGLDEGYTVADLYNLRNNK